MTIFQAHQTFSQINNYFVSFNIEYGNKYQSIAIDTFLKAPKLVLAIKNISDHELKIKIDPIFFSQHNSPGNGDILFEIYSINNDIEDDVGKFVSPAIHRVRHETSYYWINIGASIYLEFYNWTGYITKPGKYKVRFTLLKKYAPEYMDKNLVTDWFYFDVFAVNSVTK